MSGQDRTAASPSARYRTIVADPPWPIQDFPEWSGGRDAKFKPPPYSSMTLEGIKALPIQTLSGAGAHLYLWTTVDFLCAAPEVAAAWGFDAVYPLVWCKPKRGLGVGGKFTSNVEYIWFCRDFAGVCRITSYLAGAAEANEVSRREIDKAMGTSDMAGWWLSRLPHRTLCPSVEQYERLKEITGAGDLMDDEVASCNECKGDQPRVDSRWFDWPRGAHSAKPEAFLDLVEEVSPAPRLELFARRQRLGWDTWGDEALNHVEMSA